MCEIRLLVVLLFGLLGEVVLLLYRKLLNVLGCAWLTCSMDMLSFSV